MSEQVELSGGASDIGRRNGPYPAEWGVPRGERFSEERTAWVQGKVAEQQTRARLRTDRMRQERLELLAKRTPDA